MKRSIQSVIKFASAAVAVLLVAAETKAAVLTPMTPIGSGVQSRFASQSQGYMDSDPAGLNPWAFSGAGIYATGLPIPGLPAAPAPTVAPAPGNPFGGGGWTSNFNDGAGPGFSTKATSTLDDSYIPAPTLISDTRVVIVNWTMLQDPLAAGYAYNQLNFGANYVVTNNIALLGSTPNFPLYVSGSTAGGVGNFAKFDAVINYTWIPGKYDFPGPGGTFYVAGPNVSLGTLAYTYFNNSGGTFAASLNSSGALAGTTDTDGILSITGHMWIAGDPFQFNVTSVPLPATFWPGLILLAGLIGREAIYRRKAV
jgi:hypothetical protein